MKNGILYLLTGIFLLFVVENRNYTDFQQNPGADIFSAHNFAKKHHQNQTLEKSNTGHSQDSGNLTAETDDDLLPSANAVAFVCAAVVFGFTYVLALLYRKRAKLIPYSFIYGLSSVKKFILIRSIRI